MVGGTGNCDDECHLPLEIPVENVLSVDVVESGAQLDKPVQYLLLCYWCLLMRFYVSREIPTCPQQQN